MTWVKKKSLMSLFSEIFIKKINVERFPEVMKLMRLILSKYSAKKGAFPFKNLTKTVKYANPNVAFTKSQRKAATKMLTN